MKTITILFTLLFVCNIHAAQLCYNPQNDLDPKSSAKQTDRFIDLIEIANKMNTVQCIVIESEKALTSAQKLISNTATENTFWIE
jgi:hypothetical protein